MIAVDSTLAAAYERVLRDRKIQDKLLGHYKKWLRFYLDFCSKKGFNSVLDENLPPFLNKLEEKQQTEWQREQAGQAIALYFELVRTASDVSSTPGPHTASRQAETANTSGQEPRKIRQKPSAAKPTPPTTATPDPGQKRSAVNLPQPNPTITPDPGQSPRPITGTSWVAEYTGSSGDIILNYQSSYFPKILASTAVVTGFCDNQNTASDNDLRFLVCVRKMRNFKLPHGEGVSRLLALLSHFAFLSRQFAFTRLAENLDTCIRLNSLQRRVLL